MQDPRQPDLEEVSAFLRENERFLEDLRPEMSRLKKLLAARQGASTSFRAADYVAALLILLVTFIAFMPALGGGFLWDDDNLVTSRAAVKSVHGLQTIWLNPTLSDSYPVTNSLFWVEWHLFGMKPFGYHLVNIFLHGIGAVLLWRLLRRLGVGCAWLCAVLFAVHPVCVASVAWISETKNTLSLVLFALSLLLFLRFDKSVESGGATRSRPAVFYLLSLAVFFAALLSKASVAVLPLVLLLCAWWQRHRLGWRDVRRALPFFMIAAAFGALKVAMETSHFDNETGRQADDLLTRLLGGSWALWFYFFKDILPLNLCMIYPRWTIDSGEARSYLLGVLWLIALWVLWSQRKSWGRAGLFALGYFTVVLLPVLGFCAMVFSIHSQVADHLEYLAVIGVVALVVNGAAFVLQKVNVQPGAQRVFACALVLIVSGMAMARTGVFQNQETLWHDTLAKNPTAWIAHKNLGDVLLANRRVDEAARHYSEALRLNPNDPYTLNNYGNILSSRGEIHSAIAQYTKAVRIRPNYLNAHENLGIFLAKVGRQAEGLEHFEEVLRRNPESSRAHFLAGNLLFEMDRLTAALSHYLEAARLKPDERIHFNAGKAYVRLNQTNEAIFHFKESLRLNPHFEDARTELNLLAAK